MAKRNRKSRQGVHTHTQQHAGESCFICKADGNRTSKEVPMNGSTVLVCRPCRQANGL